VERGNWLRSSQTRRTRFATIDREELDRDDVEKLLGPRAVEESVTVVR